MSHMVVMNEWKAFGAAVWRLARGRGEGINVHAPRKLGGDGNEDRPGLREEMATAAARSFKAVWGRADLGKWGEEEYALYLPGSEEDFCWLCQATDWPMQAIEIVAPIQMSLHQGRALTAVWSAARPLQFLSETDLRDALRVPWLYLLGIYHFAPSISVVIGESEALVGAVVGCVRPDDGCDVVPLDAALSQERADWERKREAFEEGTGSPSEREGIQRDMEEAFGSFWEQYNRRYGSQGT